MRGATVLLGIILLASTRDLGIRAPLAAQNQGGAVVSVDRILSDFERESRDGVVPSRGRALAMNVLLGSTPPARRDSLLHGLQRLALHSDDERVRRFATIYFAEAGTTHQRLSIVSGLQRIYRARDALPRQTIVLDKMPEQVERAAAVAFLRSVAVEADSNGPHPIHGHFSHADPRTQALQRLSEMGEEGRAALRAMHRSGEAKSPQAKIILDRMAERGFPVRDLRQQRAEEREWLQRGVQR